MFADSAKIFIKSGKGGDGHVSFRRELFVAAGGPDGGDGGDGGDIIFEVDLGLNTLTDFRHIRKYVAQSGEEGGKKNMHGKNGEDLVITAGEYNTLTVKGYFTQDVENRVKCFCGEKVYGNTDIEEFINAYANSDFIVTDSFHGTCLAIIFNKPFISIANKERGEKRFVSLLKGLKLLDRMVYSVDEIYSKRELLSPIDYSVINNRVAELQAKGYEWLQNHLKKMV